MFKSETIVYDLIEIMIAIIMSAVSLLTGEHSKALAKKDYSSSKDSGGGGGDSSSVSGSGSSGKKDTSSNSHSKKFKAHVSLEISL